MLAERTKNPHGIRIPLKIENPPRIAKHDLREVHKMLRPRHQLVVRQLLHPLVIAENAKLDIPVRTGNDFPFWPPRLVGPQPAVFDYSIIFCWFGDCHSDIVTVGLCDARRTCAAPDLRLAS